MDDLEPAADEIRIRVVMSGVHPGDVKKRDDTFATGLRFPRVVPHSDGAGWVEAIGENGKVRVTIKYKSSDPNLKKAPPKFVRITERWIKVDGEWYVDVGRR